LTVSLSQRKQSNPAGASELFEIGLSLEAGVKSYGNPLLTGSCIKIMKPSPQSFSQSVKTLMLGERCLSFEVLVSPPPLGFPSHSAGDFFRRSLISGSLLGCLILY
jgi:hypothetical protein